MFRRIRYGIVLIAAGLILVLTVLLSDLAAKNRQNPETENDPAFTVTTEEESAESDEETEPETPSSEETEESGEEEPEESHTLPEREAPVVSNDEDKEFILYEEESAPYTGLRGYFFRKLVIDTAFVQLYLNVREKANPESKILRIIYPSDIIPVIGEQGDWYYVRMPDGIRGFVHKGYVFTGDDAYYFLKDTVAYAAMVKKDGTYLFMDPHDEMTGVIVANKGEPFRVIGETDNSYKIVGNFIDYSVLYVRKSQALLHYMFLGPGNDNGLQDADEKILGALDITESIERTLAIRREVEDEQEARASMEEKSRRESIEDSIAESRAREAAKAQQDAAQQAAQQQAAFLAQQRAYDASHAEARAEYLRLVQEEAANYDTSTLQKIEYQNPETGELTDACRVTFYCHCTRCCGAWGVNDVNYAAHTNGITLVEDYTVAVDRSVIPIGTKLLAVLYEDGVEYSRQLFYAADTGVTGLSIDVYRKTHTYAQQGYSLSSLPPWMYRGRYYVRLYIIP